MKKTRKHADKTLLVLIGTLLLFGIIMVYDATAVFSQSVFGASYRLVLLHIVWVFAGLAGFYLFYNLDYKKIDDLAFPLFCISIFSLVVLAIVGALPCALSSVFTPCVNGANRWIYLNPPPFPEAPFVGVLGFQPSELSKLGLIVYLAVVISKNLKEKWMPFAVFFMATGLTSLLVLLQPNMSTAALLFMIGAVMYFVSGGILLPFLAMIPAALAAGVGFMFSSDYRRERLFDFLNPGATLGYHIKQILIALGSGGLFGVGFGQSRQKFQYLPEVAADSIFAVVGEELGFVGTTVFVFVFTSLIYKGYTIAKGAKDARGRLLATGITTWLAAQFFINVAATLKLMPLTGVPLPLVSYGGSSMIFGLMGLGILANVARR
ncbi:cell division protein FtsW [candidate division WWE3 bacterium]|nr:cell division protein FtsW [candidate division WWE3 bacterium]